MDRRSWVLLLTLASLWGASYLFIKVALDDLSPPMIVFVRTALAALVLLPVALHRAGRDAVAGLRRRILPIAGLALVQVAGPFVLITVGELEIASSLAGILVASAPIFTALLAVWVDQEERSHGWSLVGVGLGIAGVALLLGVDTGGGAAALVGGLLVVVASLGYAIGGFLLKRSFTDVPPTALGVGTMTVSALVTAPFAVATAPSALPGLQEAAAVTALGVLGTGISFWIYYVLLGTVGPAKSSIVAYIAPGFSVIYGVTLLDESFTVATAAGLVLIIGGSWLAAEGRFPGRRPQPVDAPATALKEAA